MPTQYRIEFSAAAERDFELIFDHLFESYCAFGESAESALALAARRLSEIREATKRLQTAPYRGTPRADLLPGLRYIELQRAIYWFEVDEPSERVRILAIFFGGQDHTRHMLLRLLQ